MKFLDVFNPIKKGVHGFTDEAIYASIDPSKSVIPMYGGNSQHIKTSRYVNPEAKNIEGDDIEIFDGEGIIISLDGSAGAMTYKSGEKFTLNHHAGFFTIKEGCEGKVDLLFFSLFMKNHYQSLSTSDGSKTLSLDQIYSEEFELPDYAIQCKVVNDIKPLIRVYDSLLLSKERIIDLQHKIVSHNYQDYQDRNIAISKVVDCMGGNSGLTAQSIYNNIDRNKKLYVILSSATEDSNMLGETSRFSINEKPIKVFEDKEGLLVVRKGKAGLTKYIPKGNYTLNDDAYILYKKSDTSYDINLKWLAIEYREEFLAYASSSDNGTWNKTGFFAHTVIDIPSIEEQNAVVSTFDEIEKKLERINGAIDRVNILFSKDILS